MKALEYLKKYDRLLWIGVGILLLYLVVVLDHVTGNELSFSLFYAFPIALIAWVSHWKVGVFAAIAGAGAWLWVDSLTGITYSFPEIQYWNALVRLGFFLITVLSINLAQNLAREKVIASTDYVSGARNRRYFHEFLQNEIDRSIRYAHPFSMTYLDIDDFKTINDTLGHKTGDEVLRTVVETIHENLRKTDLLARIGGDEFAILLPETDAQAVKNVVPKIQEKLADKMTGSSWHITVSVGVVTFIKAPRSADSALNIADRIMYNAKKDGKNNTVYVVRH